MKSATVVVKGTKTDDLVKAVGASGKFTATVKP